MHRNDTTLVRRVRRRTGALGLVATMLSGCVIPLAPEFEDPQNYPPFIVRSNPPEGSEVTPPPNEEPEFEVAIADTDLNDQLFVRWMIDYPELSDQSRLAFDDVAPNDDPKNGTVVRFQPSCITHSIARNVPRHRVTLAVSDRPFARPAAAQPRQQFDTPTDGGYRIRATWIVNMDCKALP